ncbi:MAG: hypothetical protein IMW99_09985 [Firmicutes bacterium]|nr:hypothetical protein [Bacillota bacterium]
MSKEEQPMCSDPHALPLHSCLSGISAVLGGYGSGKTEVAIALARAYRRAVTEGQLAKDRVVLADLDVVNPYFRSREAAQALAREHIEVHSSMPGFENADLPSFSPAIAAALREPRACVVLDVGGDAVGARALGQFLPAMGPRMAETSFLWALNPYRPYARSRAQLEELYGGLTEATRQPLTGIVANPNLGPATDQDTLREGLAAVLSLAREFSLPVLCLAVDVSLEERLPAATELAKAAGLPLLPLKRLMRKPWEG